MPMLERDGVKLFYEEAGAGDPPMVFVHGWTCNHSYFNPQLEHFKSSHRVVSVDLRGHGASDQPDDGYTMAGLADDVAWMCAELGVDRPAVVGHSMGGVIALELAARHPDLASAVVMVDPAPIVVSPELQPMLTGLVEAFKGPDHVAARRGLIEGMLFTVDDDPVVKARVLDEMLATPQAVAAACFDGIAAWDGPAALRAVKRPVLNIAATSPANDGVAMAALCPSLVNGQTVGAGHFNQLLVPDQVNAMIERFMRSAAPAPARRD
jgi:pimeloyl-ACP methyl ester carboxylesterase